MTGAKFSETLFRQVAMAEQVEDVELVNRFLETREDVHFEALMIRHGSWIFRTCRRFLHSEDDAKDATQEVFARCFQKLDTLRGANLPGWLKAIAVNTCLNLIEKEKRWTPLEVEHERPVETTVEKEMIHAEEMKRARRGIETLPENQKLVFCMYYIDGCSYHQIETLTGFTGKQVKSFLQNARRNFNLWWKT